MKKSLAIPFLVIAFALSACSSEKSEDKNMNDMKDKNISSNSIENKNSDNSLNLEDRDGNKVSLDSFKGKKTYIKFWASWCPICLSSLGELDELSNSDGDYQVVSVVAPDQMGEKSKKDFIKWFDGLEYKNINTLYDTSGDFIKKFNVKSTPTNVFLDSEGKLVKVAPGALDKDTINEIFKQIK